MKKIITALLACTAIECAFSNHKTKLSTNNEISFEENKGQFFTLGNQKANQVLFHAQSNGVDFYITDFGLSYVFTSEQKQNTPSTFIETVKLQNKIHWNQTNLYLKGATIKKENIQTYYREPFSKDYYLGNTEKITAESYNKIRINEVYDGIDWVLYANEDGTIKYDFILHPGADVNNVQLEYKGGSRLQLLENGNLELRNKLGILEESAPYSYLSKSDNEVASSFKIVSKQEKQVKGHQVNSYLIAVEVGEYNKNETLVIDPQLFWGTFVGGAGNQCFSDVTTDAVGNMYTTGYAQSNNFPTQNSGGYFDGTYNADKDVVICKFSPNGNMLWSTFYGGSEDEEGTCIRVSNAGIIYITGYVESTNFPTQNGGGYFDGVLSGGQDAFLLKFDAATNLSHATYVGGTSGFDKGRSLEVNGNDVYLVGVAGSGFQPLQNAGGYYDGFVSGTTDAFVTKFTAGNLVNWSTYIGGSAADGAFGVSVSIANNAIYVAGETSSANFPFQNGGGYFDNTVNNRDGFICKFDLFSTAQTHSTLIGNDNSDAVHAIADDPFGNIFLLGRTQGTNFTPLLNNGTYYSGTIGAGSDAFIVKLSNTNAVQWGTYWGSATNWDEFNEYGTQLQVDDCGNVYTCVLEFLGGLGAPVLDFGCGYFYNGFGFGGGMDMYIGKFGNDGTQLWTTYFGSTGWETHWAISVDPNYNLAFCGQFQANTGATQDPGAGAYYDNTYGGNQDAFVAKFIPVPPSLSLSSNNGLCPCEGDASVTPTCGTAPYTYQWNTGATTQSINNLCTGTFTVTVTDANCLTATAQVVITTPPPLIANITTQTNVLCNGYCTGSATVGASGGTPGYTYQWDANANNQATSTATGLCANTYTVTVTDNNGCTATAMVTITEPPVLDTLSTAIVDATCGNANGSATVAATGGTPGYSYQWDANANNQTGQTATGLGAGNYNVTVTDANGCTLVVSITVNNIGTTTTFTDIQVACDTYTWPLNGNTYTNSTNTPTVTLVNNAGCDSIVTLNLTINNSTSSTINPTFCGSYLSPSGNTYTVAGTYLDTIANGNGCDSIITINLGNGPAATYYDTVVACDSALINTTWYYTGQTVSDTFATSGCDSIVQTNLTINNSTSSTINPTFCGSYLSPSGNTYTVAGTYLDTVANGNGCDSIITINLGNGPAATYYDTIVACDSAMINTTWYYTSQTVSDTFTTSGCDSIVQTALTINNSTTSTINPTFCGSYLSPSGNTYTVAGTYLDTIANTNGCDSVITINLGNGPAATYYDTIVACDSALINTVWYFTSQTVNDTFTTSGCDSIVQTNLTINNSTASTINPTFCGSYTSPSGNTYTVAGTYLDTVANGNGCDSVITINLGNGPAATYYDTVVACDSAMINTTWYYTSQTVSDTFTTSGCDSIVQTALTINNSTTSTINPTFCGSYLSPSGNTYTVAGTYLDTIANGNGCDSIITINLGNGPAATYYDTIVACDSALINTVWYFTSQTVNDTFTTSGCDSIVQTNLTINNSTASTINPTFCGSYTSPSGNTYTVAGTYLDTVANGNGCDSVITINLGNGPAATYYDTVVACDSAMINTTWYYTSQTVSDTFTTSGCDSIVQTALTINNSTSSTINPTFCGSYTSPSGNTYTVAGTYLDTIANGNGCDSIITINLGNGPAATYYDTIVACDSALINTTWYFTSQTVSDTFATSGCDSIVQTDLTINNSTSSTINPTFCGSYTSPSGNTYTVAGTYLDTIANTNGCDSVITINLGNGPAATYYDTIVACDSALINTTWYFTSQTVNDTFATSGCDSIVQTNLTINNSTSSTINPTFCGSYTSPSGNTYTVAGTYLDTIANTNGCDSVITINLGNGPAATYYDTIVACDSALINTTWYFTSQTVSDTFATSGCDSIVQTALTVSNVTANITAQTDPTCSGNCDGTATAGMVGGTSPYTYQWDANANSQNTQVATGLCAGSYSVTVTDANGCSDITSVTLIDPNPLTIALTPTDLLCNGDSSGMVSSAVNGGTSPYNYVWDANTGNQTTANATNLAANTYTVTVTDANGCTATADTTVAEPAPIVISTTINTDYNGFDISCFNFDDGEAGASASGGTPNYTYAWSNANNSATNPNLTAGTYTVTVTDANGCTATGSVTLDQPSDLSAIIDSIASVTCFGTNTGAAWGSGSGGVPSYAYSWASGMNNQVNDSVIDGQPAGGYWLIVQDANGCIDSALATITQPEELTISVSGMGVTCNNDCDGIADATAMGGTPNYAYSWNSTTSTTSEEEDLYNLCAGTYHVTVTDANNCTASDSTTIYVLNPDPVADFTADPQSTDIRHTEIQFTDQSQGNVNQWSWAMFNQDSTDILHTTGEQHPAYEYPQTPGTYPVHLTVISQAGCAHDTVKWVTIEGEFDIYVPNAFSPNGDGTNDFFFPVMLGVDETKYQMTIFDRWGEIIYISTHPNNHWDGTANEKGSKQTVQNGVYVYKIQATELDTQKKHELVGTVTVVK